jgi:hypothetical protein
MKNLISIILLVFIVNVAYSQNKYPIVTIIKNDTLICFTIEQSRQITIWNEERKECAELQKVDREKVIELEGINKKQLVIISNLETEINQHKATITDKNNLLKLCDEEKKSLKKEVRKQKTGKVLSIIGGVVLSVLFLSL